MAVTIDPTSLAFLLAETRNQPMHVAGLQLFETPAEASGDFAREAYERALAETEIRPLFRKRPLRSVGTVGQWVWTDDKQFDVEHHVRHSALPNPGRVRELLELCGRLHSTMLARERPLWETHIIEGLADGRLAMYHKFHHSLLDGMAAMRLMRRVLSTDPTERDMPLPFAARPEPRPAESEAAGSSLAAVPGDALRGALGLLGDAAGLPTALTRTVVKGLRNETSSLSLYAPKTMLNVPITGSRRFAAQSWPIERLQAVGKATGTTLNDVVLAMCSGAIRCYLADHGALPDQTLVAMVPVNLDSRRTDGSSAEGGNAVGCVMVRLGTDLADPEARLRSVHDSTQDGKSALGTMTPNQILAMSALGMAPAIALPLLRMHGVVRPPFNLIISNVPGPRSTRYWNGAELVGSYPLSIPIQGMALNITCASYADSMEFGLTGCRRSVPSLQRLLTHLEDELAALEKVAGVA